IAKLNIGDNTYLLDATDHFNPFGLVPIRCLNGKGRVLGESESYWYDLNPPEKEKTLSFINLRLNEGVLKGTAHYTYIGYEAANQRRKLNASSDEKEYVDVLEKSFNLVKVIGHEITNADDENKPLVVKLNIEVEISDTFGEGDFLFNPFIVEQW